jgi:hypothetical protein
VSVQEFLGTDGSQSLNKVKKTALKGCKKETIAALEKLGQQ